MLRTALATLAALALATGAAQAITVKSFYAQNSTDEISAALILAITTEGVRHVVEGRDGVARCITQSFMARRDKAGKEIVPKPLTQLLGALEANKADENRQVEDLVLGALNQFCPEKPKAGAPKYPAKGRVYRVPVPTFFALPSDKERSLAILLALSTQAFRLDVVGPKTRAQCLYANLLPRKDAQGRSVEPEGLRQLAGQLARDRGKTGNEVEEYIWGAIDHYCPKRS